MNHWLVAVAALLLSARAAPDGRVLISSMVHEDIVGVAATLKNLVDFTHPRTPVVVHLSANRDDGTFDAMRALAFLPPRVYANPRRIPTKHATGSILLGHVSNALHGASLNLAFTHVLCSASNARFFVPGVERFVVRGGFSKVAETPWLEGNCDAGAKKSILVNKWYFDAVLGADARTVKGCRGGFSQHEGMFFPRYAFERFDAFARGTRDPETNATVFERILAQNTGAYSGQAAEEVLLQTFVANRLAAELDAARPPVFAGPACAHWPPRSGVVGALDAVAYRLGRNLTLYKSPYQVKRWTPDARKGDFAFLECLGRGDAAARTALGLDGDDLAPLPDWHVQNATLACIADLGVDLGAPRRENPPRAHKKLTSLLGKADPYPDLVALAAAVRRWLGGDVHTTRRRPARAHWVT